MGFAPCEAGHEKPRGAGIRSVAFPAPQATDLAGAALTVCWGV